MKTKFPLLLIVIYSLFMSTWIKGNIPDSSFALFLAGTEKELLWLEKNRAEELSLLQDQIQVLESRLNHHEGKDTRQVLLDLLELRKLEKELAAKETDFQLELSKVRYRKGIDLIKMIYEKILGLDHHFTSLHTYQNVAMLSNPHAFPEFQKDEELIASRLGKRHSVNLPSLLETNPFVSMTFSLMGAVIGRGKPVNRENELEQIACILDFTVRMNSDLNIIYYETEFLKESNRALKKECMELFKDYVKTIGYHTPLITCRKEDDWEKIYDLLDKHIEKMQADIKKNDPVLNRKIYKKQVNLEFSIDRLLEFIHKYNNFISQGEKYYQKFQIILNNYQHEAVCKSKLPRQFADLKRDVAISIDNMFNCLKYL